uniref:Uncharacterized protein n=1 Tax=Branchiostoma floridae TaxID=7739 RepID=C3ZFN6_BRAFL|eukprot:XP_002592633.1 hypothetical protein BRAFLDRAFT_85081 [Branchiostoma floridae]
MVSQPLHQHILPTDISADSKTFKEYEQLVVKNRVRLRLCCNSLNHFDTIFKFISQRNEENLLQQSAATAPSPLGPMPPNDGVMPGGPMPPGFFPGAFYGRYTLHTYIEPGWKIFFMCVLSLCSKIVAYSLSFRFLLSASSLTDVAPWPATPTSESDDPTQSGLYGRTGMYHSYSGES